MHGGSYRLRTARPTPANRSARIPLGRAGKASTAAPGAARRQIFIGRSVAHLGHQIVATARRHQSDTRNWIAQVAIMAGTGRTVDTQAGTRSARAGFHCRYGRRTRCISSSPRRWRHIRAHHRGRPRTEFAADAQIGVDQDNAVAGAFIRGAGGHTVTHLASSQCGHERGSKRSGYRRPPRFIGVDTVEPNPQAPSSRPSSLAAPP